MTEAIELEPEYVALVRAILRRHVPRGVRVYAFGSRAKRLVRVRYADVDLCLRGEGRVEAKVINALKDAFDESILPYRVDVLDWHTLREPFRSRIEKDFVEVMTAG
ncbi:MAG: nucleotidyltransferase domain-containing protein [Alphaproteobacteria bacterium GM202ARS2]|nr:nucleotidyltransferase domain-containing protein [Alphaproteobacteria bacterium GM202ARS2]